MEGALRGVLRVEVRKGTSKAEGSQEERGEAAREARDDRRRVRGPGSAGEAAEATRGHGGQDDTISCW